MQSSENEESDETETDSEGDDELQIPIQYKFKNLPFAMNAICERYIEADERRKKGEKVSAGLETEETLKLNYGSVDHFVDRNLFIEDGIDYKTFGRKMKKPSKKRKRGPMTFQHAENLKKKKKENQKNRKKQLTESVKGQCKENKDIDNLEAQSAEQKRVDDESKGHSFKEKYIDTDLTNEDEVEQLINEDNLKVTTEQEIAGIKEGGTLSDNETHLKPIENRIKCEEHLNSDGRENCDKELGSSEVSNGDSVENELGELLLDNEGPLKPIENRIKCEEHLNNDGGENCDKELGRSEVSNGDYVENESGEILSDNEAALRPIENRIQCEERLNRDRGENCDKELGRSGVADGNCVENGLGMPENERPHGFDEGESGDKHLNCLPNDDGDSRTRSITDSPHAQRKKKRKRKSITFEHYEKGRKKAKDKRNTDLEYHADNDKDGTDRQNNENNENDKKLNGGSGRNALSQSTCVRNELEESHGCEKAASDDKHFDCLPNDTNDRCVSITGSSHIPKKKRRRTGITYEFQERVRKKAYDKNNEYKRMCNGKPSLDLQG